MPAKRRITSLLLEAGKLDAMRFSLFLSGLFLMLLTACSDTEKIVVKNDEGVVTEIYHRNKENYAREGVYQSFYPNEQVAENANYKNDTLHGERTLFYEDGKIQIEENYDHGQFQGAYRSFYQDGTIEVEGNYKDNSMEGPWKRYYPNGQLMEIVEFSANQENGPFVEYYENGQLKAEGSYLEGDFEHGLLKLYDETGTLVRKMECQRGVCQTIWTAEEGEVVPKALDLPPKE
jgi:antitoxin component YwqK of YwqJK toxin-antitoxin module